jgi:transcription antitermination factor NusG
MLVQTEANSEFKAAASLAADYRACCCYLPKISVNRVQRGQVVQHLRPFLPRYLFVDNDHGYQVVRDAPGVARIIHFGSQAVECAVGQIRRREVNGVVPLPKALSDGTCDFLQHDKVRVTDGPFEGCHGVFQALCASRRARVLIDFLGGQVRAELAVTSLVRL